MGDGFPSASMAFLIRKHKKQAIYAHSFCIHGLLFICSACSRGVSGCTFLSSFRKLILYVLCHILYLRKQSRLIDRQLIQLPHDSFLGPALHNKYLNLIFSLQSIPVDRILFPFKQSADNECSVLLHDSGILLLRQDEKYICQIFLSQFISERRFLQFDLMQKTYRFFIEILL